MVIHGSWSFSSDIHHLPPFSKFHIVDLKSSPQKRLHSLPYLCPSDDPNAEKDMSLSAEAVMWCSSWAELCAWTRSTMTMSYLSHLTLFSYDSWCFPWESRNMEIQYGARTDIQIKFADGCFFSGYVNVA